MIYDDAGQPDTAAAQGGSMANAFGNRCCSLIHGNARDRVC